MTEAFKIWLRRGHDIYIYIEPYEGVYKSETYQKKRFYFTFTDNRLAGDIYERIKQTVDRNQYDGVQLFYLSTDYPAFYAEEGQTSPPYSMLSVKTTLDESYEIQDWEIDWQNDIEPLFVSAIDPETGDAFPERIPFTLGLYLDKSSFGGCHITEIKATVYNINQTYTDYYNSREAGTPPEKQISSSEYNHFVKIDDKAWCDESVISLRFDTGYYNPVSALDGVPFNYFMIRLSVADIELEDQYREMFSLDSIDMPDSQNVSIVSSIEQCLTDPDVIAKMKFCPIYTIYVKTNQR